VAVDRWSAPVLACRPRTTKGFSEAVPSREEWRNRVDDLARPLVGRFVYGDHSSAASGRLCAAARGSGCLGVGRRKEDHVVERPGNGVLGARLKKNRTAAWRKKHSKRREEGPGEWAGAGGARSSQTFAGPVASLKFRCAGPVRRLSTLGSRPRRRFQRSFFLRGPAGRQKGRTWRASFAGPKRRVLGSGFGFFAVLVASAGARACGDGLRRS